MPSGKKHIQINWIFLVILNIIILIFIHDISIKHYILFNIIFILTSYFISPDLDLNSSVYKRWSMFRWIWYPYREIMKHRGASHSFIWGPISILMNLFIYTSIVFLIVYSLELATDFQYTHFLLEFGIIITICVILIVWIHIIADKIL